MDVYGTAVTAITQAYQVTVFIQGVISDIKSFDEDREEVRLKLNVQLSTLLFFRRIFVHPEHGLLLPGKLDTFIAKTIEGLLVQMRKTLTEYELVAVKYGLVTGGDEDGGLEKPEEVKESLLHRIKIKAMSLKMKGYDWSLFDKKRLHKLLEAYTNWSADLRNLMQHLSQDALSRVVDENDQGLKATGLEPVMKRRKMVDTHAPNEFQSLEGQIIEEGAVSGGFQLGRWTPSGSTSSTMVVIEFHEYEGLLKGDDLEPDEIEELKAPIRNLAWLLKNSTFNSHESPDAEPGLEPPQIYALKCLGFIDQPEEERNVFLYSLPTSDEDDQHEGTVAPTTDLTTLHGFINAVDRESKRPLKRPSLNDRFSMAHCLAITLLNVHASKWVHKNVWSRGILLFLQTPAGVRASGLQAHRLLNTPNPQQRILAYLSDWGYARSEQQGTDMRADFEAEPNLYRHPDRQGRPTRQFQRRHDIYALGVVLLEIGLWVTLSRLMETKIREAEKTGRLPRPKKVAADLVALAQQGLPKEMGEGYAQAVVDCLTGNFREGDVELALDFQEKVVNILARGMML
ncbi:uncharacterized protein BO97DRAFT_388770 [Aspergillus homomorphus CBS 101889]|uniref:Protein kinase domain-containing protein n=1 Tax=Aspergillus homomorphus (strain CBS 101889) TaxID=1450537 RepID=A0A395I5A7_ASPHC|nr:hypothetical protein BO97DRAFT_388770 [Aspergillus homomorphus CBS 101889]RAL13534.1 hypothetical protein BO97DRAFT_388770 [Aspergillus homomorphus CBS 101889]